MFGESTDVSCIASKRPAFFNNLLSEPQRCEHGVKPLELMINAFRKDDTSTFPKALTLEAYLCGSNVHWPRRTYELPLLSSFFWAGEGMARLAIPSEVVRDGEYRRISRVVKQNLFEEFVTK